MHGRVFWPIAVKVPPCFHRYKDRQQSERVLARDDGKAIAKPTLECLVTALFGLCAGGDCELLSPRTLPFLHTVSHEPSVVISRSCLYGTDAVRRDYADS